MENIQKNLQFKNSFFSLLDKYTIFKETISIVNSNTLKIQSEIETSMQHFDIIRSIAKNFIKIDNNVKINYTTVIDFFTNIIRIRFYDLNNIFHCKAKVFCSDNGSILFDEVEIEFREAYEKLLPTIIKHNISKLFSKTITDDINEIFSLLKTKN